MHDINLDESKNTIEYSIKEKEKIETNNYLKIYKREFNLKYFNKGIIKILNKYLNNFEENIFTSIKLNEEYCSEYYSPFKNEINEIIKNILKSTAAQKYFNNTYKRKYNYLIYHFNNDDLINEVLSRISFAPIFSRKVNAYTDPIDLSITINAIPGKYGDLKVNLYNQRILQLGRVILFALHEIMGHFMRRYYSYLTHGKISFNTNEDKFVKTGKKVGFYIENEFFGFDSEKRTYLTISDALCLFNWKNYEDYPVKNNNNFDINETTLKDIISNNKKIFNFIGNEEAKIKFADYLILMSPINSLGIQRKVIPKEDFIYLDDE